MPSDQIVIKSNHNRQKPALTKSIGPAIFAACLALLASGTGFASDWVEEKEYPYSAAEPPVEQPVEQPAGQPAGQADPPLQTEKSENGSGHGSSTKLQANIEKSRRRVHYYNPYAEQKRMSGRAAAIYRRGAPLTAYAAQQLARAPVFVPPKTKSVSPDVFKSWLEKSHPGFAVNASKLSKGAVLDVRGQWDNASRALRSLGIPHTSIRTGRLKKTSLDAVKILVINCAGEISRPDLQAIRTFVSRGGFLISTDWALDNVIAQAFPGYVEWNGGETSHDMMDAILTDPDPELTAGTVQFAGWKVDKKSQTVRVLKPSAVRVLAQSKRLVRDDPDGHGVLACTFKFGRGQVLHLVGHFDNNSSLAFRNALPDPAPGMGISLRQAIAANFVVKALKPALPADNSINQPHR